MSGYSIPTMAGRLPSDPVFQQYSIARPGADESLFLATLDVTGSRRQHQAALGDLVRAGTWLLEQRHCRLIGSNLAAICASIGGCSE